MSNISLSTIKPVESDTRKLIDEQYNRLISYTKAALLKKTGNFNQIKDIYEDIAHDAWYSYQKYQKDKPESFDEVLKIISRNIDQAWIKRNCRLDSKGKWKSKDKVIYTDKLEDLGEKAARTHNWYDLNRSMSSLEAIRTTISKKRYPGINKKRSSFKTKIIEDLKDPHFSKVLSTYSCTQIMKAGKNGRKSTRKYQRVVIRVHKSYTKG